MNANTPHADFLRNIQNWLWKRFPTRQLSATDIFYVLQWANSAVPCCIFIDGFESWIHAHPGKFENDARLSSLQHVAWKIIASYRKKTSSLPQSSPLLVDDPYEKILNATAHIGQNISNPLLREILRTFYTNIRNDRTDAQNAFPTWNQRADSYYPFRAQAILDFETERDRLILACQNLLSERERQALETLSPQENLHCMIISENAQKQYKMQLLRQKIAQYFDISDLMDIL